MNTYYCSDGRPVSQDQIDRYYTSAAKVKIARQREDDGYNHCEDCGVNELHARLDVSHQVSRAEAKNECRTELIWDVDNLRIRCRACHQRYDGLALVG